MRCMSPLVALFGPHKMSDLSPECAPKRTSVDQFELWVHAQIARRANHSVFSEMTCPAPFCKKYFASLPTQIGSLIRTVPSHRGADRVSSRTRDGMRWTRERQARRAIAGRD